MTSLPVFLGTKGEKRGKRGKSPTGAAQKKKKEEAKKGKDDKKDDRKDAKKEDKKADKIGGPSTCIILSNCHT